MSVHLLTYSLYVQSTEIDNKKILNNNEEVLCHIIGNVSCNRLSCYLLTTEWQEIKLTAVCLFCFKHVIKYLQFFCFLHLYSWISFTALLDFVS